MTGHTGFKGSWLTLKLNSLRSEVIGYALDSPTNLSLFELCMIYKQMKSIIADVRDGVRLNQSMIESNPDIVIHMAAQPLVRESYKYPVETYSINVIGIVNIFEAVLKCKNVKALI